MRAEFGTGAAKSLYDLRECNAPGWRRPPPGEAAGLNCSPLGLAATRFSAGLRVGELAQESVCDCGQPFRLRHIEVDHLGFGDLDGEPAFSLEPRADVSGIKPRDPRDVRIRRLLLVAGRRQRRCGSSHLRPPVNGGVHVARAGAQPYLGPRTKVRRHDDRWGARPAGCRAGLVDVLRLHIAPLLLGCGDAAVRRRCTTRTAGSVRTRFETRHTHHLAGRLRHQIVSGVRYPVCQRFIVPPVGLEPETGRILKTGWPGSRCKSFRGALPGTPSIPGTRPNRSRRPSN